MRIKDSDCVIHISVRREASEVRNPSGRMQPSNSEEKNTPASLRTDGSEQLGKRGKRSHDVVSYGKHEREWR